MIHFHVTGDPFKTSETVLGLFSAAIRDMKVTGASSCTALVTFTRMPEVKARFRISLVVPMGASRPKRRPAMTRKSKE